MSIMDKFGFEIKEGQFVKWTNKKVPDSVQMVIIKDNELCLEKSGKHIKYIPVENLEVIGWR